MIRTRRSLRPRSPNHSNFARKLTILEASAEGRTRRVQRAVTWPATPDGIESGTELFSAGDSYPLPPRNLLAAPEAGGTVRGTPLLQARVETSRKATAPQASQGSLAG